MIRRLNNQSDFTIPELLVVIILTTLFTGLIMQFGINYWRYGALLQADLDTFISRLNANDILREQLGTSSGLITQNSIADTHVTNPDPAITSGLYWLPLHAVPNNTVVPSSGTTPLLYFRRFAVNSSGAYIMNGSNPYENEYVLYFDGPTKELRLRSLANPSASGNSLKTSCPPANATASCPADRVISNNMASIDRKYFSRSGNTIDYTSIVDPITGNYIGPDFPAAEVIELNLHLSKKPLFQQSNATVNETIIRIALRNT